MISKPNYALLFFFLCCGGILSAQTSSGPAYDLYDGRRTDSKISQEERKRVSHVLDDARNGTSVQALREARRKLLAIPENSVDSEKNLKLAEDKETTPEPPQPPPLQDQPTKVSREKQRKPFVFPANDGGGKEESDPTPEDL